MDGCRKRGTDGEWSNYRRIRNNWRRISERVVTDKGVGEIRDGEMQRGRKTGENREMKMR